MERVFAGSPSAAVAQALDATNVSDEELAEIRRMVDRAAKQRGNQRGKKA